MKRLIFKFAIKKGLWLEPKEKGELFFITYCLQDKMQDA